MGNQVGFEINKLENDNYELSRDLEEQRIEHRRTLMEKDIRIADLRMAIIRLKLKKNK